MPNRSAVPSKGRALEVKAGIPRIALIGISGYGRVYLRHLEAAAARGEIRFAAAVVINPEEEQDACLRLRAMGVSIHGDWREMLETWRDRLDLCMIPVPIHLHHEITVAALESGANVLVEKPLAATLEQALAIQEMEERSGRWVAVGYQNFYAATTQGIRARLTAGHLGQVRLIQLLGLWPRSRAYFSRNDWAGRMAVRGRVVRDSLLNNAMAHFVNLSLYWAGGDPASASMPVELDAELFRCFPIESFDTAVVRLKTDSGVSIRMAATHCCPEPHPIRIQIEGDEGDLTWIHRNEVLWRRAGQIERWGLETEEETVEAMFAAVLRRLSDPQAPICTSALAISQVACLEAIHEAAAIRHARCARPGAEFGNDPIVSLEIENEFRRCLRSGALPSEIGFAWALADEEFTADKKSTPLAARGVGFV